MVQYPLRWSSRHLTETHQSKGRQESEERATIKVSAEDLKRGTPQRRQVREGRIVMPRWREMMSLWMDCSERLTCF